MKKIICILLLIMSILCTGNIIVSAQAEALSEEELGLLKAISYTEEGGFSENDNLTRGEFSYMLKKLFKYDYYSSEEFPFRDIDSTHPYYDSIGALYEKGIIQGINKYTVAPDTEITLGEAEKMAVRALGYGAFADMGNETYSARASQLGLYKGISMSNNDLLTEEIALRLMYNILFAPIMGYEYDGNNLEYVMDENVIMMGEIYDLYEVKGIVTENSITSLYGESSLTENRLKIGTDMYETSMENADELLGYYVKAYVRENEHDDFTMIYAYADKRKNDELIIMSEDISQPGTSAIKYYTDNKEKRADLSNAVDVIYNGIGVESFDETTLNPSYGSLKLVDNDKDGEYDVVFVTDYSLMVVQNISSSENELNISEKFGNHLKIDYAAEACSVMVYVRDKEASLSEIKSGTVALVEDSGKRESARIIKLHICADKVSGTLTSSSSKEISVDQNTYPVCDILDLTNVLNAASRNVTVYIDKFGNAVYIENAAGNLVYGFMMNMFPEEGYDDRFNVKILDTNNEWHTYPLKEKISCNGKSKKSIDFYKSVLIQDESGSSAVKKQLVRYAVNADGVLTALDIAEDGTASIDKHDELTDKQYFRISFAKKSRRYAHNTKGLFKAGGYSNFLECFFDGTVQVLIRPDTNNINTDEVMFASQSYFQQDTDYICEGYDVDEQNNVKALVVYKAVEPTIGLADKIYVIDCMKTELNEDDEVENVCYAWQSGSLKRLVPADGKSPFENLKKGDVVRFKKSPFDGKIDSIENDTVRFRVDDNPEQYFTDPTVSGDRNPDHSLSVAYAYDQEMVGRVKKIYGNYLRIKGSNDTEYFNVYLGNSATKYVVYDSSNSQNPLSLGSKNNIALDDIIVAQMYFGRVETIVIYK